MKMIMIMISFPCLINDSVPSIQANVRPLTRTQGLVNQLQNVLFINNPYTRTPLPCLSIFYLSLILCECGPGSSVGIETDYGLDGPGSNPGEDEIFRPSRPAQGPTQPPVKWVPGLSRG